MAIDLSTTSGASGITSSISNSTAFTLPGHSDADGTAPNLAKTKDVNGKTVETNPPKAPAGVNSSNSHQSDGPSTSKLSQGVLANTMTSINNALPTAGCPIALPNILEKLKTNLKLMIGVETSRESEWADKIAQWFADTFDSPGLTEEIHSTIESIKSMIKEIEGYIKQLKTWIQQAQQFITELTAFIAFLATIPARLVILIKNCLSQLVGGAGGLSISSATAAISSASSAPVPSANT